MSTISIDCCVEPVDTVYNCTISCERIPAHRLIKVVLGTKTYYYDAASLGKWFVSGSYTDPMSRTLFTPDQIQYILDHSDQYPTEHRIRRSIAALEQCGGSTSSADDRITHLRTISTHVSSVDIQPATFYRLLRLVLGHSYQTLSTASNDDLDQLELWDTIYLELDRLVCTWRGLPDMLGHSFRRFHRLVAPSTTLRTLFCLQSAPHTLDTLMCTLFRSIVATDTGQRHHTLFKSTFKPFHALHIPLRYLSQYSHLYEEWVLDHLQ